MLPGKSEETVQSGDDAGGTAVEPSGEGEALATMALAKGLVLAVGAPTNDASDVA